LNEPKARQETFRWLKQTDADVIILQETKCHSKVHASAWLREWFYPGFFGHNNRASASTATLLTKRGATKVKNLKFITDRCTPHYLASTFTWNHHHWTLHNLYCPSEEADRVPFLENLRPYTGVDHTLHVISTVSKTLLWTNEEGTPAMEQKAMRS